MKIYSHKRSGTHLLMATLWENFHFRDVESEVVKIDAGKRFVIDGHTYSAGSKVPMPWRALFGSHDVRRKGAPPRPPDVLYIVRHPIPVLMSQWRVYDPMGHRPDAFLRERSAGTKQNTKLMKDDATILTPDERRQRHKAAMKKYYQANKAKYRNRYIANSAEILAVQKVYRDMNKEAIRLRDKIYNDTKRSKE